MPLAFEDENEVLSVVYNNEFMVPFLGIQFSFDGSYNPASSRGYKWIFSTKKKEIHICASLQEAEKYNTETSIGILLPFDSSCNPASRRGYKRISSVKEKEIHVRASLQEAEKYNTETSIGIPLFVTTVNGQDLGLDIKAAIARVYSATVEYKKSFGEYAPFFKEMMAEYIEEVGIFSLITFLSTSDPAKLFKYTQSLHEDYPVYGLTWWQIFLSSSFEFFKTYFMILLLSLGIIYCLSNHRT